jgi:hypothetical protein
VGCGNKNEKKFTRWLQATLDERRESCDINHIIFGKKKQLGYPFSETREKS